MTAIGRIIAVGGLCAAWVGCAPGFNWSGHWVGERDIATRPDADPAIVHTLRTISLTIQSNGEFEMIEAGVPRSGLVRTSGVEATLETVLVMGRPLREMAESAPLIILKANSDGTITLVDPSTENGKAVVLHRKTQPNDSLRRSG